MAAPDMSDLTPANAALLASDPLNQLRVLTGHSFTMNSRAVADALIWAYSDLALAEEYGHPVLSQTETIKRATERVELCLGALKQSRIVDLKCRRGEWIASA